MTYPQEIIFCFYERKPALISSVVITLPKDAASSPKEVEVWTSMDSPTERFVKIAAQPLKPEPGDQAIAFTPAEARYVKLRVLSSAEGKALEIGEVQIIEAQKDGYTPLLTSNPGIARCGR